jgi:hypothetical protein
MKRVALAASVVAAAALLAVTVVAAPPKGAKGGDAPTAQTLGGLEKNLKDLHWGMTHDEVNEAYNKPGGLFDQEYAPQLVHEQPGVAQQQLEADRDNRKVNLERSYTRFLDTPTGYDNTAIKSEYTYRNDEALESVYKEGRRRFFFFIKDKLWKVMDEMPLKAEGPLGGTFQDAVGKLNAAIGVGARIRPADQSQGLDRTTADWQDSKTHVRALDRSGENIVAIVLEDKGTVANLSMLRTAKPVDPFAIDPSIAAVTKHGVTDPNAARDRNANADAGTGKGKKTSK